jgi:hypothetical protein
MITKKSRFTLLFVLPFLLATVGGANTVTNGQPDQFAFYSAAPLPAYHTSSQVAWSLPAETFRTGKAPFLDPAPLNTIIYLPIIGNLALPPPYNLSGQEVTTPFAGTLLSWAYDDENAIIGFRLFRNTGSGFTLIANEDQLNNLVRNYFDLGSIVCAKYYITAVYLDATGQPLETAPSNQFSSLNCP